MKDSTDSSSGIVTSTKPMRCVFALASAWAAPFGFQPNSWATCSTLARVPSETPGLPLRAYETALLETPDALATSKIVTLLF